MSQRDEDTGGEASRRPPSDLADQLRGFGPVGLFAVLVVLAGNLVVVPLSAVLVLGWARLSRTPWRTLGLAAPRNWVRTFAIGVPLGVTFKLAMKAVVMPLLGAPAVNAQYQFLRDDAVALLWVLYAVVVGGGFGEEVVFRGFLFERLGALWGARRGALPAMVLLTSGLFALAHYPEQGVHGAGQAAVTGVVFGALYGVTRQVWLPMVVHAAFNVTAVALIYWRWEAAVAHLLFP